MKVCSSCGNEYPDGFQIKMSDKEYYFDSFECAIHLLAPRCHCCGVKILGHGFELDNIYYCSAHCVRKEKRVSVTDHLESTRWGIQI